MFNAHFNSLLTTRGHVVSTFTSVVAAVMVVVVMVATLIVVTALTSPVSVAADVDPTRPFGVSSSSSNNPLKPNTGFVLSSIIHGNGIHTAVINGKIYKMFDYVGEYRITAINSYSVILRSKSKRLKINVFKSKGFKSSVLKSNVLKDNVIENTVAN